MDIRAFPKSGVGSEERSIDLTYRKDERNTTPDSFGAIKVSLGADEQILLALCSLPRKDISTKKEDLDGFTGW